MPATGPTLLAVSHPASFLDALILVAAFDRPVSCLLPRKFIRGFWAGLWARGLRMIPYHPGKGSGRPELEACCNALAGQDAAVVFAEPQAGHSRELSGLALTAALIAMEAEAHQSGKRGTGLVLLPVHLYLPVQQSQSSELLIYVDSPLLPREHLIPGGDLAGRARARAALLESRWRENPFGLQGEDLKRFTSDLEELLRANLEEDWASRANWKQKIEEFQLSGFAAAWAEQANYLHPGRLVALREALEAFRESRRRGALRQAEVEAAGAWLGSPLRRGWVWFESAVGWPVALYGLSNHLLALLILFWAGLLKTENDRDQRMEWLSRGVVLLGCYAVQILLVAYLLGRPAAGYYAPTLPVTGLYLWRYLWLLRHRTRPAFLALLLPAQARKLRRRRREFVAELDETLQAHAALLGMTEV